MLTVRLEPELEERLATLARETGRTKSYYAKKALEQFLEDRSDYLLAIAALERNEPTLSADEVRRELGI